MKKKDPNRPQVEKESCPSLLCVKGFVQGDESKPCSFCKGLGYITVIVRPSGRTSSSFSDFTEGLGED